VCFSEPRRGRIVFRRAVEKDNEITTTLKIKIRTTEYFRIFFKDISFLIKIINKNPNRIPTPDPNIDDRALFRRTTKKKQDNNKNSKIFNKKDFFSKILSQNLKRRKGVKNINIPPKVRWVFIKPIGK
jgi:hypothetical protein